MKKYEWILFDADETLFHFDSFSGLQLLFSRLNYQFSQTDFEEYQNINKALWVDYQNGTITADYLQQTRLQKWAVQVNASAQELSHHFLLTMAEICKPLNGALDLLALLKGKTKLGIITNGFTALQNIRLERVGLKEYFDVVIISEEVGIAKPHMGIFHHALNKMASPLPTNVLMVGDTLESDILGGINVGFDTCWLNTHNKTLADNIRPHYQVKSLVELKEALEKIF